LIPTPTQAEALQPHPEVLLHHHPNQNHVKAELHRLLFDLLPALVLGLALFYVVTAFAHLYLLETSARSPMFALSITTALILFFVRFLLLKGYGGTIDPNGVATAITLLPLFNIVMHMYVTQDYIQTTNIALLLMGMGCFSISLRWYVIACILTIGSWAVVINQIYMPNPASIAFMLLQALGVSILVFVVRYRSMRESVALRLYTQEQNQRFVEANLNLKHAQQQAEHERQAADVARASADQANQAKRMFLAHMTHELRTPLTAMLGYCELMEMSIHQQGHTQLQQDISNIRLSGTQLKELINSVLDMSKIEAGHLELFPTQIYVPWLVDQALTSVRPLAEQNNNTIQAYVPPELPTFMGDEMRVRQILINLLSNACRFTNNGTISLKIELIESVVAEHPQAPQIVFHISDTGVGMTPEQLTRLFQDFVQVGTQVHAEQQGTGIGLSLSHQLTRLMGGEIRVTSIPGTGSTFSVYLPLTHEYPRSGRHLL
jgi:signal transduction histidine kinase